MEVMPSVSKWKTLLLLSARRSETERLFAEAARAEETGDYEGAAGRLREIVIGHPESPRVATARLENDELQSRLDSAESGPLSVDGTSDSLEELEGRIHWSSGHAPRRER